MEYPTLPSEKECIILPLFLLYYRLIESDYKYIIIIITVIPIIIVTLVQITLVINN